MFENFDMNQQHFISELEIVRIIKAYRQKMSSWYELHKNNLYDLKTEKIVQKSPLYSMKKIRKYYGYTKLISEEVISFEKVIIKYQYALRERKFVKLGHSRTLKINY